VALAMALPGALAVALGMASRLSAKLAESLKINFGIANLELGLENCKFRIVSLEL